VSWKLLALASSAPGLVLSTGDHGAKRKRLRPECRPRSAFSDTLSSASPDPAAPGGSFRRLWEVCPCNP